MLAASAFTTAAMIPVFLTSSLAVQISRDITFTGSDVGVAVAAFFASSAACASVSGRVADRVGGWVVMRFALVPTFLSLLIISLFVDDWETLVATLALAGMGNGIVQPAANRYLAHAVGPRRRGLAFGTKQGAIPAAALLSGLAVPSLALTLGWRSAFAAAATLPATMLVLSLRPHQHRSRTDHKA